MNVSSLKLTTQKRQRIIVSCVRGESETSLPFSASPNGMSAKSSGLGSPCKVFLSPYHLQVTLLTAFLLHNCGFPICDEGPLDAWVPSISWEASLIQNTRGSVNTVQ